MDISICEDDPSRPQVAELLAAHRRFSAANACSQADHAADVASLCASEVTFWSAREGVTLLGCAALREIEPAHAEIKSMHTDAAYRGRGVGTALMHHLLGEAHTRHYVRLSLETGASDGFAAARALYSRFGFEVCGPFHTYPDHPDSFFMTLELARGTTRPSSAPQ
ncbi:MAG: GNAT family N-acetyltransferase [Alphaproteobacteria bacterium]